MIIGYVSLHSYLVFMCHNELKKQNRFSADVSISILRILSHKVSLTLVYKKYASLKPLETNDILFHSVYYHMGTSFVT